MKTSDIGGTTLETRQGIETLETSGTIPVVLSLCGTTLETRQGIETPLSSVRGTKNG